MTPGELQVVQEASLTFCRIAGARGMGRVDFILDASGLWFLELNSIPGLTPESIILKEAAAAGLSLEGLLDGLVRIALGKPFHMIL